ncbi:DoxX family membrane protein [Mucilaginibacter sp. UR6-11]|uniref:DoxX family membrane protein n=1 Tax=Mucilaginibacter sp. UR6-11 TaxID=1435644 RepID=UPI001E3D78AD|nr:DoxX family membrane protein [Mucilaginibacter sp. UR6-11]MCC8424245.1 DoxX family membrane protein [Mucilaginibacter sp. UR6-11]
MKIAVLIARILLGLIFVVFGLNFFFPFMPKQPMPTGAAGAFAGGLWGSGYFFQYLKVIEIVSGLFLLLNRYTAFFLLALLPISVNIFLYHAILLPAGIPVGAVVIVLNIFLCIGYIKYYKSVFTAKPTV